MYRVEGGKLVRQQFRSEPQVMDRLAWIAGDWDVAGVIFATAYLPETTRRSPLPQTWSIDRPGMTVYSQPLGKPEQRIPEMSWDPYGRKWVSVALPPNGYGIMTAEGWRGDRLDLIGKVAFPGGEFVIRHSLVRLSPDYISRYKISSASRTGAGRQLPSIASRGGGRLASNDTGRRCSAPAVLVAEPEGPHLRAASPA